MMKRRNWSHFSGSSTLGYSRTVKQVVDIVQGIMDKKGIDVTVSASWWKSSKMRHRDIVLCTPETHILELLVLHQLSWRLILIC